MEDLNTPELLKRVHLAYVVIGSDLFEKQNLKYNGLTMDEIYKHK